MHDIFTLGYKVRMSEESNSAELSLYGEIVENSPKWWRWSDEDKSAAEFKKAIDDVRKSGATKLLLRINSPGGICTEAVAMRSILSNAGFDEIDIRIEGMCASAATTIATIPEAHVSIAEGSEYMIHNPWTLAIGNANELEHTMDRLRNIEQMSRAFYMKKTGQPEEQIKEWMDAETWFTADQAVEYGFADEILSAGTPTAACATSREMAVMNSIYKAIPQDVALKAEVEPEPTELVAGEEDNAMELTALTMEQLREGNPELFNQVRQGAIDAERERLSDIDALTVPGYEELAEQAKTNGTSAMDFQKQIVAAMKQKGNDFMQARQRETAPAQEVLGGEPTSNTLTEEQEIQNNAQAIAEYAKGYVTTGDTMF